MESGSDLHDLGKHGLGPHVVGTRVVVRRLLPGETGPTGGPAFTDVLGHCVGWADGVCTIEKADGTTVRIAIAQIVSGKPVPPRPPVRHRISDLDAERHSLVLWPHVETASLGDWLMRTDPQPVGRLLKRANSVLAIGSPGVDDDAALSAVVEFYRSRDREPLAQVVRGSDAERLFEAAGWEPLPDGDALFQLGSIARAARSLQPTSRLDFASLLDDDRADRSASEASVGISDDGVRVSLELRVAGRLVAGGRGAVSGDWFGVHALSVDESLRRRGLSRRILAELLDWAAERGATTWWLHVESDNHPALALYESLGLSTHHELRYLHAPS